MQLLQKKVSNVHSNSKKKVRDLNMTENTVILYLNNRKIYCPECNKIRVEHHDFVAPNKRITKRLERYIFELCKHMTIKQVAKHLDLDWKTIKAIDKSFLEKQFEKVDYSDLKILAIDEISQKKRHKYLTIILNYETGRIVWIGNGRKKETLDSFFNGMTEEEKNNIEAVAMDMWRPYMKAAKEYIPNAKIVFDFFHVVKEFSKVIDKIRAKEYSKANETEKLVIKGSKYLLLKNKKNLKPEELLDLNKLLNLNQNLLKVYILKDLLKEIWKYKYRKYAEKIFNIWRRYARQTGILELRKFARKLLKHKDGILNHCKYRISTGKLEGTNNKLKVIKRKMYGFIDTEYFKLKAMQAFPGISTN